MAEHDQQGSKPDKQTFLSRNKRLLSVVAVVAVVSLIAVEPSHAAGFGSLQCDPTQTLCIGDYMDFANWMPQIFAFANQLFGALFSALQPILTIKFGAGLAVALLLFLIGILTGAFSGLLGGSR